MKNIIKEHGLKCLALIGSHARGDDDSLSDIDLLGIVANDQHNMINVKKVNLSIYSETYLRSMMSSGELFALHIVSEGISLVNEELFKSICDDFKYKPSYQRDKQLAYMMGVMILSEKSNISNWMIANKRITWCVRTYILALMAEERRPYFSKESIAFHGFNTHPKLSYLDFINLINAKQHKSYSDSLMMVFERFIKNIEYCKPDSDNAKLIYDNETILKNTLNQMLLGHY